MTRIVGTAIVSFASFLVPAGYRRRWLAEWRAEQRHFSGWDADLVWRSAGAFRHALWLRMQEWRIDMLLQDLKYALRSFGRARAFTTIAVLTLAIGIGANAVVFGLVNTILLRPFPYPEPDHLVVVESTTENGNRGMSVSAPDILDVREQSEMLADVFAWDWEPFNLRLDDRTVWLPSGQVTWSIFEVLGVQPIVGRTFVRADDEPDAERVVVLSEGVWRDHFASDPGLIGEDILLDGSPATVIGVVPNAAAVPDDARAWITLRMDAEFLATSRGGHWLRTVGRLAPGVTIEQANAEMATIASRLEAQYPETNEGRGIEVRSLREARTEDFAALTLILLGSVGFLLLIVCANVANLLLARASAREREIGIRVAMGASRSRLVRQLVSETLLLAAGGAILGFLFSRAGMAAIVGSLPEELPSWMSVEADGRVLAFVAVTSIVAALIAGLAPAIQASRPDLTTALKGTSRGASSNRGRNRARSVLVAAEVALAVTLLVGAGLMIRSFVELSSVAPGFEVENRLTARMALSRGQYGRNAEAQMQFVDRMTDELMAIPGVREVSVVDRLPLGGSSNSVTVFAEGQTDEENEQAPSVLMSRVGPRYFETMGIPLQAGREFTATDDSTSARVSIVSSDMAERYWPDESPIGRRFRQWDSDEWIEVVGMVDAVRHFGLENRPVPQAYLAFAQAPGTRLSIVLLATGKPATLTTAMRQAVRAADPDVALADEMTLESHVAASTFGTRFFAQLFWVFAAIAAILAAIGVYGVVSFSVAQRTREFGIRMALGSGGNGLLRLAMRDVALVLAIGLILGLIAAFGLSRVLSGFLYEVRPGDPLTFAAVLAILGTSGLLAAWVPARRAARVDPAVALRED